MPLGNLVLTARLSVSNQSFFGQDTERVTENFFGISVEDCGEVKPTPSGHFGFSHINVPELIGVVGYRF